MITSAEPCIFDQCSRCLQKGGCCNLNCNSAQEKDGTECHGEMGTLIEWREGKAADGEGSSGSKPG